MCFFILSKCAAFTAIRCYRPHWRFHSSYFRWNRYAVLFHIFCSDALIACPLFNLVRNSVVHSPSSVIRDPRYGKRIHLLQLFILNEYVLMRDIAVFPATHTSVAVHKWMSHTFHYCRAIQHHHTFTLWLALVSCLADGRMLNWPSWLVVDDCHNILTVHY